MSIIRPYTWLRVGAWLVICMSAVILWLAGFAPRSPFQAVTILGAAIIGCSASGAFWYIGKLAKTVPKHVHVCNIEDLPSGYYDVNAYHQSSWAAYFVMRGGHWYVFALGDKSGQYPERTRKVVGFRIERVTNGSVTTMYYEDEDSSPTL